MINDPYHYKSKFVITVLAIFVGLLAYGYIISAPAAQTNIQNTNNDNAQLNEAIQQSDITKCDELDGTMKNNCIYVIISRQAVQEDNPELCGEYPASRQQCIEYYENAKAASGEGTCADASNKDSCYLNMAISKSDSTFCWNIEDNTIKNNCINVIGDRACSQDSDCSRGLHIGSEKCFIGNKNYIDGECMDASPTGGCEGPIKCAENTCTC